MGDQNAVLGNYLATLSAITAAYYNNEVHVFIAYSEKDKPWEKAKAKIGIARSLGTKRWGLKRDVFPLITIKEKFVLLDGWNLSPGMRQVPERKSSIDITSL